MYYLLTVLLLAPLTRCVPLEDNITYDAKSPKGIFRQAPHLTEVTAVDPPGLVAEWSHVEPLNKEEAVVGYKVRLWETPETTKYHYVLQNGIPVLVPDTTQQNKWPQDPQIVPEGKYKEVIVGENENKAQLKDLKENTWYEVRVLAYTKSGEGPISNPVRVKIGNK